MNNIEAICREIDENPTDKLLWGILGDMLEEKGDKRSEGMRWLIKSGHVPSYAPASLGRRDSYLWFNIHRYPGGQPDDLPSVYFDKLQNFSLNHFDYWKEYPTFSSALLAAAEAYVNKDKIVHHINGNREDNRPENITFIDPKENRR